MQEIYRIKKSFLVPLGVDAFLICILFLLSLMPQGSATERIVFSIFLVPALYVFGESLFRRVTVDEKGIVIRKLLREKEVSWEGVTHVGSLRMHNKIYLLLTTVAGFFIISNAYGKFRDLAEEIVSRVDPTRVEAEVRLQTESSLSGVFHSALAWVAAAIMAGIIFIKVLPLQA